MILMPMRQHDAEQVVQPLLDKLQVGQDQVDAGIVGRAKDHAAIDHDPLAVAAIEVDVHANLTRATEREEEEFFTGGHMFPV